MPPFLSRLLAEGRLSRSDVSTRGFALVQPLREGGVLELETAGRGEAIVVRNRAALETWLRKNFPAHDSQWHAPADVPRARAVTLRRSSKAAGRGVGQSVLHLRALARGNAALSRNGASLPVVEWTTQHGLAACLIDDTTALVIAGRTALVENLECFLKAERVLPDVALLLHSAGRVSERLISCLGRSRIAAPPLLHWPDYDPVGLSDYLRLRAVLGERVRLFVPPDIATRFAALADRRLITTKPRNRRLLETLNRTRWPCRESEHVFQMIKESGSGLEQEGVFATLRE